MCNVLFSETYNFLPRTSFSLPVEGKVSTNDSTLKILAKSLRNLKIPGGPRSEQSRLSSSLSSPLLVNMGLSAERKQATFFKLLRLGILFIQKQIFYALFLNFYGIVDQIQAVTLTRQEVHSF